MTAAITDLSADAVLPQVCTPCMAQLDARPWHRTLAVRTGPLHTGVRVNTAATAAVVEDLLAPLRVPEMDGRVSPNFSVESGERSAGRRGLHLVYRDHEIVGRRRDADALLLDLVELLDEVPRLAVVDRAVVHATGVITASDEAVLLPGRHHKALLTRRQQLADAGLELLRTRTQQVDTAPAELMLSIQDGGLAEVLAERGADRTSPCRCRLRVWGVPAVGTEPFDLRSPEGVVASFPLVVNRQTMGAGRTLHALREVAADSRFVAVPDMSSSALVRAVVQLSS